MRVDTMTEKGRFFAALSIGATLRVALCTDSGVQDENDPVYDAEVIAQSPDDEQGDVLVNIPEIPGGFVVTLPYVDGESLWVDDPRPEFPHGGFFAVADVQLDDSEPEMPAEPEPSIPEPGSTLPVRTDLPRSASWLLTEALILETEAAKYRQYSPPHQSLTSAAASLRSAVGHVLAGGCEAPPAKLTTDPF